MTVCFTGSARASFSTDVTIVAIPGSSTDSNVAPVIGTRPKTAKAVRGVPMTHALDWPEQ